MKNRRNIRNRRPVVVDFLTYCQRVCTWYNYGIITNDDLYCMARDVVEAYYEAAEFAAEFED